MNRRKYLARIGIAQFLSLLSTFRILHLTRNKPVSYSVFALFSGALLNVKNDVISMLSVLFPVLLLCFYFADFMQSDYASCCVYIFTRTDSRVRWFSRKAAGLLCWITVFYILDFSALYISAIWTGISFDISAVFQLSAWTFLFNTLAMFILLLPINLLAIRFGTVIAYLAGIGVYLMLLSTAIVSPSVARWLPVSQGMYAWHDTPWPEYQKIMQSIHISGFSASFSIVYMLLAIAVEAGIGMLFIKKMDFLNPPEGGN